MYVKKIQVNLNLKLKKMTVVKKNILRKVKDIAVGSSLCMILASGLVACGSNDGSTEGSYDTEEVYTQGVKTYIKEVSKGEFKITEEKQVPIDSAAAYVTYLDGKTEIINPKLAKELIDENMNNTQNYGHRSGLSNVLLYGGMGYMFARMSGNNNAYAGYRQNYDRNNSGGTSVFYSSPKVYEQSQAVHRNVGSSRVSSSRPSGSRSGFFGGS